MDFKKLFEDGLLDLNLSLLPKKSTKKKTGVGNVEADKADAKSVTATEPVAVELSNIKPEKKKKKEDGSIIKNKSNIKTSDADHKRLQPSMDYDLDRDVYLDMEMSGKMAHMDKKARKFSVVDKILKTSSIVPGFEKLDSVPMSEESKRQLMKKRQMERESSKGKQWFNMPAPELTDEMKRDLEVLQMRSALDPKHFYKKNDLKVLPKFFQVGRVLETPADFYNSRVPKKQRKKTIVDELMADADFKSYNKRRYAEIIEERRKTTSFKAFRHAKRLKQKGKSKK